MAKVSFIIPVYKVEKYLEQCVSSILNQTYKDFEIILVDDGSPDNCPRLCDELASNHSCIYVIHKNNGGSSSARNIGLQKASGEYIIFVDSDDFWIEESALTYLVRVVESENLDFLSFNYQLFYEGAESINSQKYPEAVQQAVNHDVAIVELVKAGYVPMSAWSKIIRRDILINNNILFQEGVIAEDFAWFIELLEYSSKCKFIDRYVYAYRQNIAGSITSTPGDKNFIHGFTYLPDQLSRIEKRDFSDAAKEALLSFYAYGVCILIALIPYSSKPKQDLQRLREYYWLLDYDLNPKVHRAKVVKRLFGKRVMELLLQWYINHRGQ